IVSLILLQTQDGYIAKDKYDDLSWGPKGDKKFFKELSTKIHNIVIGGSTYKAMPDKVFETRNWFVFTNNPDKYVKRENVHFVKGSASEVVKELEKQGIHEILVAGGSEIYSMFIQENLYNDIYLTIAPINLGTGIKGIDIQNLNDLKLSETIHINKDVTILHYTKA